MTKFHRLYNQTPEERRKEAEPRVERAIKRAFEASVDKIGADLDTNASKIEQCELLLARGETQAIQSLLEATITRKLLLEQGEILAAQKDSLFKEEEK